MRLHAASQLLGIVSAHAGHPARGLYGLAGNGVVGVFLPVAPGVEGGDRIYFEGADQKDQPGAQLDR